MIIRPSSATLSFHLTYRFLILSIVLCAPALVFAVGTSQELREEFHRSYVLSTSGMVSVSNSMGTIRIEAWDRGEVRIDAVKRAYRSDRLAEAVIEVQADSQTVSVGTRYPQNTLTFSSGNADSSAIVEFTVTVPRGATVNALSQSGDLSASGLTGPVKLTSMSGNVEALFDQVSTQRGIELKSMSGSVTITLPSDANADVTASSISNQINNDFGLTVNYTEGRKELSGRIGGGGVIVTLSSMSGPVGLRRAVPSQRSGGIAQSSLQPSPISTEYRPAPVDTTPPRIKITSPHIERGVGVTTGKNRVSIVGTATDESGVREVVVSGERARFDREGNFSADIALASGANKIEVTATDTYGNSATEEFTIDRALEKTTSPTTSSPPKQIPHAITLPPTSITPIGRYYAIIIGNNNYKFQDRLETAVKDAKAIDKTLREDFGFETTLLLDADRDQVIKTFNDFRRKLDENSNLLIYYAGHGFYDKEVDKAYWLPVDARTDDNVRWISADEVTTNIRGIHSRQVLIISDSCYSGMLQRTGSLALTPDQRDHYIQKMMVSKSRLLMTSGGNEPVADSGGFGHSIFANALLNGLGQMERNVFTAGELFYTYVRESVAGKSDQTPQYNPIRNSGHDSGDFVFFRKR